MNKAELIAALEARIEQNNLTNAANPYDSRPLVENTGLYFAISLAEQLDEPHLNAIEPVGDDDLVKIMSDAYSSMTGSGLTPRIEAIIQTLRSRGILPGVG